MVNTKLADLVVVCVSGEDEGRDVGGEGGSVARDGLPALRKKTTTLTINKSHRALRARTVHIAYARTNKKYFVLSPIFAKALLSNCPNVFLIIKRKVSHSEDLTI